MPRRVLDKYVTSAIDRHGRERYRFRRGVLDFYLPMPGTREYREAYKRALEGFAPSKKPTNARTVGALMEWFYRSPKFLKGGDDWQATVRGILDDFHEEFRNDRVEDFTFEHIEEILLRKSKRTSGQRIKGGSFAAKRLHEQLKRVFALAVKKEWIASNPAEQAELPVNHVATGFYSWTERDIEQFQAHWPVGSKPRLAMEIALWTGLRRGDVASLGPKNLIDGRIYTVASKTGKRVSVIAVPPLLEAIEAAPTGDETFLITDYGKPFSTAGFGNWFRDRCNEAGLPQCTIHGLRKALARRAAKLGLSQQTLKAIGQWSNDEEVATYVFDAEQEDLADAGVLAVNKKHTSPNPPEKVGR